MNRVSHTEFDYPATMRENDPFPADEERGIAEFFGVIIKYWLTVVLLVVLGAIAGSVYGFTRIPVYASSASIILTPAQPEGDAGAVNAAQNEPNTSVIESEIEVLRSRGLAQRLVKTVGVDVASGWLSHPRSLPELLGLSGKPGPLTDERVVSSVQDGIRVARKETSFVVEVSATAPSPANAVEMADGLTDVYLNWKAEERARAAEEASLWLNSRLDALRQEVERSEAEVAAYRAQSNLIDVNGARVTDSRLSSVQTSLLAAQTDYSEKQARLSQLTTMLAQGGSAETVLPVLNSSVILELRQQQAEVARRVAELNQRYLPDHPDVIRATGELAETKAQLDGEVRRIIANFQNEVQVARLRVTQLEATRAGLEKAVVGSNRDEVQLRDLERQAEAAAKLYQEYLATAKQSAEVQSRKVTAARILSPAALNSDPVSPSPVLWIAFFTLGGLLLGIGVSLVRASLSNTLFKPEDVQRKTGRPALVTVPLVSGLELSQCAPGERTPSSLIVAKPMSRLAECVRMLLAQMLSAAPRRSGIALAVTSAVEREGKTTIALSLARIAASSGLSVLIVEGDLRVRSLSKSVSTREVDLNDVLQGTSSWRNALIDDKLTSVKYLVANSGAGQLSNAFARPRIRAVLGELREAFDLVIFDCPPVLAVAEARTICELADGALIVANWNRTPSQAVRTAVREIEASGGKVLGVSLNRIRPGVVRRTSHADSLYFGKAGGRYYAG